MYYITGFMHEEIIRIHTDSLQLIYIEYSQILQLKASLFRAGMIGESL